MKSHIKRAIAIAAGFIVLWYAGAMVNFFPFAGNDLVSGGMGSTGLLVCVVLVICTCWIVDEIRKTGRGCRTGSGRMTVAKMKQSEALEIADCWKYDGEYAFYDMTADSEDYEEITSPDLRGDRYFSVFNGDDLMGFFCVEQKDRDISMGLGLRPDLTGQGRGGAFLAEILQFVRENYRFGAIRIEVASFNQRAVKVYERAGFVKTGTAKVPTNGGIYDFTLMEWKRQDENKASDRT